MVSVTTASNLKVVSVMFIELGSKAPQKQVFPFKGYIFRCCSQWEYYGNSNFKVVLSETSTGRTGEMFRALQNSFSA